MGDNQATILEPKLAIIDAHHHLIGSDSHSYTLEDYQKDCAGGHKIVGSVYIEVRQRYYNEGPSFLRPIGETEFVAGLYDTIASGGQNLCQGIIGYADLELGQKIGDALDAHIEAGKGKFKGIRRGLYWSGDQAVYDHVSIRPRAELMLDPNFRSGFAQLQPRGLTFDAVLFHPQLTELANLAKSFPDTIIVLNHVGFKLGVGTYLNDREQVFKEWRNGLKLVSNCPNVMVKIGGLGMKIWGFGVENNKEDYQKLAGAWREVIETGIELFGIDRCLFESNYPVDGATTTFNSLWNALKFITRNYSNDEKEKLYFGNTNRVYGLGL
ncbi:amidohydrolase family protein [Alphaproteobacteria bacterium]|nr:amidohydrolase family protein [Alphaproteobacteria bacterium]